MLELLISTELKRRLDLVDVKIGDYVIVHTGFAIEKMDEKDALESLDIWKELLKAEEDY